MNTLSMTPETLLLTGRTIFVSGAASGMGRSCAQMCAYQSANVICADLNLKAAHETVTLIQTQYPHVRAVAVMCDVTEEASVEEAFAEAIKEFGAIDGLAHCAGIFAPGKEIQETSLSHFTKEWQVNTLGVFLCCKAFVQQVLKQNQAGRAVPEGGYAISVIVSMSGLRGTILQTAYASSKHAALGVVRCIAQEQAKNYVRSNAVCPGPVDTPLMRVGSHIPLEWTFEKMMGDFNSRGVLDGMPLKTMGKSQDIAAQMINLLGPRSAYVTGSAYRLDGGWCDQ